MDKKDKLSVVLLGSGNVAWHLGKAMFQNGIDLMQVYSPRHAEMLANELQVPFTTILSDLNPAADMYVLSLRDDAYASVIQDFPFQNACMAHTSGSLDLSVFEPITDCGGVFYPFQTFTKGIPLSFEEIPICIETSDQNTRAILVSLAQKLSKHHYFIDSKQRKKLHLAGVYACNFSNALYGIAKQLVEEKGMDFSILLPLIQETARKVQFQSPKQAQTGPAARNDTLTMETHLAMINGNLKKELYVLMSEIIRKKL
ncbi:MAG: DUF2520 domain-containing protein [Bacteroidales bacterium]|nr:DUF2520 domain-containing protein [Bacteroidales bacterium]